MVQVRDVSSAIEIKAPRSRTPNLKDLERAAIMVANARDQLKADHAVLVISLRRETIEAHEAIFKDITLLCLDDLFSAALERDVTILNELVDITRELNSGLAEFDRRTDISPAPPPLRLDALRTKPASELRRRCRQKPRAIDWPRNCSKSRLAAAPSHKN